MEPEIFKEFYEMVSDKESKVLSDTSVQLCEYMDSNIPESERDYFTETILAIMDKRQEYFFRKGFEFAIKIVLSLHED